MEPPPFLERLDEASRARLSRAWRARRWRCGETVLVAGGGASDLCIVLEGATRASIASDDGRLVSFKDFGPGDMFGEFSAIDGLPRSADVVALADCRLAHLPAERVRRLVQEDGALAWALLQHVVAVARQMNRRIFEVSTMVVRERLLLELLRLGRAGAGEGNSAAIRPAPTHQDIAARISTHREAVSREMSRLAKRGLVAKQEGALVIRDLAGLARLAEEGGEGRRADA